MTAWSFPRSPGRTETLDPAECRRLLGSTTVGRLGYTTPAGPRIIPLNYALLPDTVLFRTVADGEVTRYALGQPVAFEADDVDAFLRSGWSVLVTGELHELSADAVRQLAPWETAEPWAAGERPVFCAVALAGLTGRRVLGG